MDLLPNFIVYAQCTADGCPAAGVLQVQELLTRFINLSVGLAFLALTTWLAWGAVKLFITSGGDPKALAHAWQSVTWAFVGIFFLVLAFLTLRVIYALTGVNVTQYCIGFPGGKTGCLF